MSMSKQRILGCKYCGLTGHLEFACHMKPRKPLKTKRRIRPIGKKSVKWLATRRKWLRNHPPNHQGYYICYLCGIRVHKDKVELDHIYSRSRRPDLVYNENNLRPCCHECNQLKGSKSYEYFAPHLKKKGD